MNTKIFILATAFCLPASATEAQSTTGKSKPPIDGNVVNTWPKIDGLMQAISNNGKYVLYGLTDPATKTTTAMVQSTDASWKQALPYHPPISITPDSRYIAYIGSGDSLALLNLQDKKIQYIPGVRAFRLPQTGNWIFYQGIGGDRLLVARNTQSKKEWTWRQVNNYWPDNNGSAVVVQMAAPSGNNKQALVKISLATGKQDLLWQGTGINDVLYDNSQRLAFVADDSSQKIRTVYYYQTGMKTAELIVQEKAPAVPGGLKIGGLTRFSRQGKKIFITLRENKPFRPPARPAADFVKVSVWSYRDAVVQSFQQGNQGAAALISVANNEFMAVIDAGNHTLSRLEQQPGELMNASTDDVFLTVNSLPGADFYEHYWNQATRLPVYLVSATDGSRKKLPVPEDVADLKISAAEKFMVYWNGQQKNFFTYEIASGITRNITGSIHTEWIDPFDDHIGKAGFAAACWQQSDESVILYDAWDIWLVDPTGNKPAINLTNGVGRKNDIIFRLAENSNRVSHPGYTFPAAGSVLLNAFNRKTKQNGFYTLSLNGNGQLQLLTMGNYVYELKGTAAPRFSSGTAPIKAADAAMYLVHRMSATEYENLFSTTDFKTFTPLTNIHPEKEYNWLTTEVHNWQDLHGNTVQGLLYKPENFDSSKKYPVIFYIYERLSDGANIFKEPLYSDGRLNIPWMVSNGYLVFSPDINITWGEQGESAVNVVVSAAKYLTQKPFVNAQKMAIQGISYGGFETYYVLTHTNIFAAAAPSAGITDMTSFYTSLRENTHSMQSFVEAGQIRMNGTLWEMPSKYIANSAIMRADKIVTPVLMFHGRLDGAVPFNQAMEFYLAMRRLGKRAWLLDYEDGAHGLQGKNAVDYTTRLVQFFDHYLKDAPAPKWMLQGIPANRRGIDDGYELVKQKDENGHWVTPGPGLAEK